MRLRIFLGFQHISKGYKMRAKGILVAIPNLIGALKAFFHIGTAWKRRRNDDRIMRETNKHAQRDAMHRKLSRKFGRGFDVRAFRKATA